MRIIYAIIFFIAIGLIQVEHSLGRAVFDADDTRPAAAKVALNEPYVMVGVHKIGKIALTVSNQGHFGKGFIQGAADPFYGGEAPSCIYPYPGRQSHLFAGSFWIGAVVGRDTLVSVGADGWHFTMEMWPDPAPRGRIILRSMANPDDKDAVSEQDYIAVYTDTVADPGYAAMDPFDGRPHYPLGIEVTQRSYSWSYPYAEDFVLFDYSIKNIGNSELNEVYMGFYVDGDVERTGSNQGHADDVCGFRRDIESPQGCGFKDTINIAWIADNDGRESDGYPCPFDYSSLTAVTGMRVVRTPSDSLKYSFNWWISNGAASMDFGPRRAGTKDDPFRDFGGFLGTPESDRNKYYVMRHEEFDYDQLFCAVDHSDEGWLPRSPQAFTFANGFDTRYLLSCGPFDISPGEILPISFAYVGGENFHSDCYAFLDIFDPEDPYPYYNQLSFDDLGKNAMWASWIYDNPGVDTDGDGYRGKRRFCNYDSVYVCDTITADSFDCHWEYTDQDTFYYEGDRVPDFRGAAPPLPPEMWVVDDNRDTIRAKVYPRVTAFKEGELRIRWNGLRSETVPDPFSNKLDFEGYRVYKSLSPTPYSFSLVASYDLEDFNRYVWTGEEFKLIDLPFTLDSLKSIYGDDFDPSEFDVREHLFSWNDSLFYFRPKDHNYSNLADTNGIHKVYPDEPLPTTLVLDSARLYYPEELTPDGFFFKYYEYEYIVRRLLPSQMYYVAVTAFDYGAPGSNLESLETPPYRNYVAEYALNDNSVVENKKLNVIVYPNPYRADGNYRELGFEGRDYIDNSGNLFAQADLTEERTRSIHFINLPHRCTIKIFTLDGDLVREIEHDYPEDSPRSMWHRWDMITRNTQPVVSGIYYYTVESEHGTQIGKLVIIL
jgi:hypothetical protein